MPNHASKLNVLIVDDDEDWGRDFQEQSLYNFEP